MWSQEIKILSRYLYTTKFLVVFYFSDVWLYLFILQQVNQIRRSLAIMGENSTAFSLPQVYIFSIFFQSKFYHLSVLGMYFMLFSSWMVVYLVAE